MRVLRTSDAIRREIALRGDASLADLLAARLAFIGDYDDADEENYLSVIVVEVGDGLSSIDREADSQLMTNLYSGKKFGEPGFRPCFETLEEYPTFYEIFFILSDAGHGLGVYVPKRPGICGALLSLCALYAVPAEGGLP